MAVVREGGREEEAGSEPQVAGLAERHHGIVLHCISLPKRLSSEEELNWNQKPAHSYIIY